MPRMRITPEDVAGLGLLLHDLATQLEGLTEAQLDIDLSFGPGEAGPAFSHVLANWRRNRLLLARALDELGAGARAAASGYLTTEGDLQRYLARDGSW